MNSKIHTILLDLGGVVFNATGTSNQKIDWGIITQLNHKYGHQLNIGEDVFPLFMLDYNQLTNQTLTGSEFLEFIFDTLSFNSELVDFLKPQFRIYIVSDNYKENIAYISQRYHFATWAEKQFYSFDFQLEKSNPLFFQRLLDTIKLKPEELLFIDDSKSKIESAEQSGIRGVLFENNEQLYLKINEILERQK